jgi:hypothetical protein
VIFQSLEDVAQEINKIFAMMEERRRLDESDVEDGEEAIARNEQAAEMEQGIAEGLEKISAVWGLNEYSVEGMSPDELLQSNPAVLKLLGTTQTICSGNAEEFAERVKPFLDSSNTAQGFKAWPLITEVRLFVKSPVLKNGLVLVDLPGLSDAVESRAHVAELYRQKLEITAIVAPARRAIDEKTGVQLMNEYQTLRMQFDGKYYKKGFCVMVSQSDELDCDVFVKGHQLARQDKDLQHIIKEIDVLTQRCSLTGQQVEQAKEKLDEIARRLRAVNIEIEALTPTGRGSGKLRKGMYHFPICVSRSKLP